jgi:hypothetical protein
MMTPAAQALLEAIRKKKDSYGETGSVDGKDANVVFGKPSPFNDPDVQDFIMAGFEFASKGEDQFSKRMAVAVSWIYLGYMVAQNEVKQ